MHNFIILTLILHMYVTFAETLWKGKFLWHIISLHVTATKADFEMSSEYVF